MIDLAILNNDINIKYNLIQDICNSFHITDMACKINLGRLYKILDMRNRYYDTLFTSRENMYLKSYVLEFTGINKITIIDKVTNVEFRKIGLDLIINYLQNKEKQIDEKEILNYLKSCINDLGKPALIGSKYTSYIDPLGTTKNKILVDLHLNRVSDMEKEMNHYLKHIEKDLFSYRGFNSEVYERLKKNFLESNGSDLARYNLKQYINCVMKSVDELNYMYGEEITNKLLNRYNLIFKKNVKSPSNIREIRQEIKNILNKHTVQNELNKITQEFKNRCDALGRLDYNVKIYKELMNSLHHYDFFERTCRIFREYYKVDVIECLIVIYSVINRGENIYEI